MHIFGNTKVKSFQNPRISLQRKTHTLALHVSSSLTHYDRSVDPGKIHKKGLFAKAVYIYPNSPACKSRYFPDPLFASVVNFPFSEERPPDRAYIGYAVAAAMAANDRWKVQHRIFTTRSTNPKKKDQLEFPKSPFSERSVTSAARSPYRLVLCFSNASSTRPHQIHHQQAKTAIQHHRHIGHAFPATPI